MNMTTSPTPTPSRQGRTWFITGASTGFGRLLAEEVLKAGGKVIATARKLDKVLDLEQKYPGKAKAFALDVTDYPQIASVVAQTTASTGRAKPSTTTRSSRLRTTCSRMARPVDWSSTTMTVFFAEGRTLTCALAMTPPLRSDWRKKPTPRTPPCPARILPR